MKKAHCIGVCGAGMSAVARLLQQKGYQVSGSDDGFYPPISDYVAKLGIETSTGYRPSNIPDDVDCIVIGKNAKLTQDNPEVAHAFAHHADVVKSFPEVIGELNASNDNIVVAGSYGKSTLTSLIAWILIDADKDPSYFVGAQPKKLEYSSALREGEQFILEGDEYPSANWDNRSKFLHYNAATVVLTAACHDHINIYPTLEEYHKPFKELMREIQSQGALVACTDQEDARKFYEQFTGNKTSYGLDSSAEWSATDCVYDTTSTCTITHNTEAVIQVSTSLLGQHNTQNIVGAAAVLLGQKLVTPQEFAEGVASFEGLVRRLDAKVRPECAVRVYEGFGSSYEKARSAIDAMKLHFPHRRISVVFEPHTFTWRNRNALSQYKTAFADIDTVWIYEPPTQGAATHDQLSLDEIVSAAQEEHNDVRTFDHENYQHIVRDQSAGDVVLLLSSANFGGLQERIIDAIDNHY